jgi:hypothetical protein
MPAHLEHMVHGRAEESRAAQAVVSNLCVCRAVCRAVCTCLAAAPAAGDGLQETQCRHNWDMWHLAEQSSAEQW